MNKVIQDGVELHDVEVVINGGVATVTPIVHGPGPTPFDGGGPGEEHGPK